MSKITAYACWISCKIHYVMYGYWAYWRLQHITPPKAVLGCNFCDSIILAFSRILVDQTGKQNWNSHSFLTFIPFSGKQWCAWRTAFAWTIPCFMCHSTYAGHIGRQFATRMREHQSAVKKQDENSLFVLHCLTTSHVFDWTRASVVENEKRTRDFISVWKATPAYVNHCRTIGSAWTRSHKSSVAPPPSSLMFHVNYLHSTPSYATIDLIPPPPSPH